MSTTDSDGSIERGGVADAHEFFGRRLTTFEETVQDFQDASQEWRRLFSE